MTEPARFLRLHPDGRLAALIATAPPVTDPTPAPVDPAAPPPPPAPTPAPPPPDPTPPAERTPLDQVLPPPTGGVPFRIPIMLLEGFDTSDDRYITPGVVGRRDLPQTLMAMLRNPDGGWGHDAAIAVGRIDTMERVDASAMINRETGQAFGPGVWAWQATGFLTPHPDQPGSTAAVQYIRDRVIRGVSVDLGEFQADVQVLEEDADGFPERVRMVVTEASIAQATVAPFQAFPGATIELVGEEPLDPTQVPPVDTAAGLRLIGSRPVLTASAGPAPLHPPAAWFTNQHQPDPTRHVYLGRHPDGTPTGQVWGYVARWGVPHAAVRNRTNGPVFAPRLGPAGYRTFLAAGSVLTAEGEEIATGLLTHGGGHADLRLGVTAALAHYDQTSTAYADVVIGEDEVGIWHAGAMRPELTVEQIETFGRHPLSGDWRGDDGDIRERLLAVCSVNTAGFTMARLAASGARVLVAAGARTLSERADGVDAGQVQAAIDRAVAPILASAARSALDRLTRRG